MDLILLDLKLPDIEGKDLISEISRINSQLPFIVITGQGDEQVAVEMMKRGALDYLVKDVRFQELVPAVVRRALSQIERDRKLTQADLRQKLQHSTAHALAESATLAEAAPKVLQAICHVTGLDLGEFWTMDTNSNRLRHFETWHTDSNDFREFAKMARETTFGRGIGLPGRAWQTGKPLCVQDVATDSSFVRPDLAAKVGLHGAFAIPIRLDKETLGVMTFFSREYQTPDDTLMDALGALGSHFAQFAERKRAEEALYRAHALLEQRIQERTAALATVNSELKIEINERKQAERALRSAHAELEQRVRERTAELATANKTLQTDIAERKRLEKEILEISDREQRRIGQDLHDGLGQHLAGIELMSQVLEQKLSKTSKSAATQAQKISAYVRDAISQARLLARGLSPVVLESQGLMFALEELASRTEGLFAVSCRFYCRSPVLIHDNNVATHLYRIAQEAVTNAVKHGKAKQIEIILQHTRERTSLVIKDNGCGFPKDRSDHKGMGLQIMQYRASMIGGSISTRTEPDGGALVTFTLAPRSEPRNSRIKYEI